jgi:hypothetical protein
LIDDHVIAKVRLLLRIENGLAKDRRNELGVALVLLSDRRTKERRDEVVIAAGKLRADERLRELVVDALALLHFGIELRARDDLLVVDAEDRKAVPFGVEIRERIEVADDGLGREVFHLVEIFRTFVARSGAASTLRPRVPSRSMRPSTWRIVSPAISTTSGNLDRNACAAADDDLPLVPRRAVLAHSFKARRVPIASPVTP